MKPVVRKEAVILAEVRREMDRTLDTPLRKCAAVAILENIYSGRRVDDLSLYGAYGTYAGRLLANAALDALGIGPEAVHSYGKAAVVGAGGELEHGSALLHIAFDDPVRELLRDTKSLIPSSEKVGPTGCSIDVPLHHKKALKVRTHYDTMEVSIADAPLPGEVMLVLCLSTGSRPFPRVGGLLLQDIKGVDGVS